MQNFVDGFFENRCWLNLVQYNASTGSYSVGGVDIQQKIYTLGEHPYPWDVPVGKRIFIDPACLTGYGATLRPIELITDGEVWLP